MTFNFLRLIFLLPILLLSPLSHSTPDLECIGDSSLPMYGYNQFHRENSCDKQFIKSALEVTGNNRLKAAQEVSKRAWEILLKDGDQGLAIKRFNQAWLLDRNSVEVFWGFAVWESLRTNTEKAEEFFEKAYSRNSKNSELLVDYAKFLIEIGFKKDDEIRIKKARKYLDNAKVLNPNLPSVYVQSASFYMNSGLKLFRKAWDEVEAGQKIDSKSFPANLISDLERVYPRKK